METLLLRNFPVKRRDDERIKLLLETRHRMRQEAQQKGAKEGKHINPTC
jgi:hypothetical protein